MISFKNYRSTTLCMLILMQSSTTIFAVRVREAERQRAMREIREAELQRAWHNIARDIPSPYECTLCLVTCYACFAAIACPERNLNAQINHASFNRSLPPSSKQNMG